MASPEHRRQLAELQRADGNRACIDCGAPSPQWASVSLAVFFCIDCSGLHRALGVQLSFVRSVSMDRWSDDQIRRLQAGGNQKCLAFFRSFPEYRDGMAVREKYGGEMARLWRDKLDAEVDGREWVRPAESADAGVAEHSTPSTTPVSAASEFKTRSLSAIQRARSASPASFQDGAMLDGLQKSQSAVETAASTASEHAAGRGESAAYFTRLGEANAARPDTLPPNQGGRYTGFGSAPPPSDESPRAADGAFDAAAVLDDPLAALTKTWSFVSKRASVAITAARDTLADPEFGVRVTETVSRVGRTVVDTGMGVGRTVSDMVASGSSSLGSGQQQRSTAEDDFWQEQERLARSKSGSSSSARRPGTSSTASKAGVSKRKTASKDWDQEGWDEF